MSICAIYYRLLKVDIGGQDPRILHMSEGVLDFCSSNSSYPACLEIKGKSMGGGVQLIVKVVV